MPAIGKDLAKIRSHLGLSIQDIQNDTKIPVSTLKKIEDGSIFDHPDENQTYIRSFVRSYGRALKISGDMMIKALDQNETGNYNHLLLENYPELNPDLSTDKSTVSDQEKIDQTGEMTASETEEKKHFDDRDVDTPKIEADDEINHIKIEDKSDKDFQKKEKEETDIKQSTSGSTGTSKKPTTTNTERSIKSVDWADVGRKFNQEKKPTPVWLIGFIIILIIVAILGYFLYQNGLFNLQGLMQDDPQEQVSTQNETSTSSLSLELTDSESASESIGEPESAATLTESNEEIGDVLELTLYAAYDGLGPVRVWSDLKPRMDPYWLNQGTAMRFEFEDTIRVRGPYSDFLILKNGHLIENASQNFLMQEEDYIQLTRDYFESDPKWSINVDYELPEGVPPPDSIATRPAF